MNVKYTDNITLFDDLSQVIASEKPGFVIVPNEIYRAELEKKCNFPLPPILTFEGLDISPVLENFRPDVLSRNAAYAVICEIIANAKMLPIEKQDITVFARTMIGELPNIIAHGLKPDDILNKIPVKISMQKEINIQCFVAIWKAFEAFLKETKKMPYYKVQAEGLESLKASGRTMCVVHDAYKSRIYGNFIKKLIGSNAKGTILIPDDTKRKEKITATVITGNHITEARQVADTVKHILAQSTAKIGIICTESFLHRAIVKELRHEGIKISENCGFEIRANPLLRLFTILLERKNIEEVLPVLNIARDEKLKILQSIISGFAVDIPIWSKIARLFYSKTATPEKIDEITDFIKDNINALYHKNTGTMAELLEFSAALKKEITALQNLGITADDNFFRHFAASWKIWHEDDAENVSIISPEEAYLKKYDTVILTSGAVLQPKGNIVFSEGLRKYYGFAGFDYRKYMIANINANIIITKFCKDFTRFATEEKSLDSNIIYSRKRPNTPIAIKSDEVPSTIGVTALETLISDPQVFYYKYIKSLDTPRYNLQQNLDLGNIVHNILENAVKNRDFDKENIGKYFGSYGHRAVFFENRLLEIITDINNKLRNGIKIEAEAGVQIQIVVQDRNFTITAKCDRTDTTPDGVILYDYKSGSDTNFTKSAITKKFAKAQLYIPALALQGSAANITAKYCFLQNKDESEIATEITPDLLQKFQNFVTDLFRIYFIEMQEIEVKEAQYTLI